jgi:hypothetical protein
MRNLIFRTIVFGSSICFAGLAIAAEVKLDFAEPDVSNLSFTVSDARPKQQIDGGSEAFSVGNCAYSSLRIGDDFFTPTRVSLVSERLQRDYSAQLAGKTVIIQNFVMHRNFGKQARDVLKGGNSNVLVTVNGAPNAGLSVIGTLTGNAVGRAMANSAPMSCAPDDLRGGYSPEETPNDIAPFVIVLDLLIDKTPIHVRTVYEPVLAAKGEKPNVYVPRVIAFAMTKFLDDLSNQMALKMLPQQPTAP